MTRTRSSPPPSPAAVKVYRVGELTRLIKAVLEDEFGDVWVEGEISNLRQPGSGHVYFTLKDASAQLRAVLFRGDRRGLALEPADGLQVRAFGRVTVYEAGGQHQLVVRRLEPLGAGALQAAFEALKRKLREEGLFDEGRKRPLPLLPQRIGLVTSPTGAVIRDLLSVLTRRFPNLYVLLAPVRVQGAGAADEIAAALDLLNAQGGLDVLVVARGGGSLEDLWAFNEEAVARAIARSRIPVVSAVGHETDVTIADFVADLRAPTPSAAAELIVGCKADFERRLAEAGGRLVRALRGQAVELRGRFAAAAASHVFREPGHLVRQVRERLARYRLQLRRGLEGRFRQDQQTADELELRLVRCVRDWRDRRRLDLRQHEAQLRVLSPLAVLARGYSITTAADGRILTRSSDVRPGDRLRTRLAEGSVTSDAVEVL
jgi:exodeoxyribonuclease VII large subunit